MFYIIINEILKWLTVLNEFYKLLHVGLNIVIAIITIIYLVKKNRGWDKKILILGILYYKLLKSID